MEQLKAVLLIVSVLIANAGLSACSCYSTGENSGNNEVTLDTVSESIARYTLNQYRQMINDTTHDNILTSPFSIWSALALTYLGARGQSSAGLGRLLGLDGLSKAKVEDRLRKLSYMVSSNNGSTFTVASKISIEQSLQLKNCVVNDSFAALENADFRYHPESERIMLNNWVWLKTNGHIEDLLPKGSISSSTLLAIVNAAYFKGNWSNEFNKDLTKEEPFYSPCNDSKVQMMHREGNIDFGSDKNLGISYVDLPYAGDKYSMLAILPNGNGSNIDTVIEKMTPTTLKSIWNSTYSRFLQLGFPKFELKESYNLKDVISKMGASNIFESLNLSGFVDAPVAVRVADVYHKVFVKVEEKGSEAAGATGVAVNYFAGVFEQPKLIFNRPFAFIIREKSTNVVLFMGVVRNLGNCI